MKHIVFISQRQWKKFKKKEISAGDIMLYKNRGKKDEWEKDGFPPVKVEVKFKEIE